jgi:hypothetical protein
MVGSGGGGAGVQRQAVQFWDGSEHRAFGNLGAILAMGNADFRTAEISRLRQRVQPDAPRRDVRRHQFTTGSIDGMGIHQSTDPTWSGSSSAPATSTGSAPTTATSPTPTTHQT